MRLQSDEKLIGLTRRGQHAAFEVLCSRYESRLLAFCRHMLGSREDAEDVLQEVFAAAFNAVLADEREINARPWLYRIARNRSLNHLRRASAIGVDSMDVHFADYGTSTSDRVLKRESFRELLHDVGQLPETQRTALLLREIDALSYEQIADAMETTVPSVKSLLVRARISLAEAAEARKLSCDEVRLELGHVAEGLEKMTAPVRRHVRDCERCRFFKRQLRANNQVLAAIFPVAPLLLLKKLVLAKLGATASAGSAHVASGAGATVGAGALVTAGGATGAAGVGGAFTIGAGAVASKAVAGLAAAAIVGAGAVAANHLEAAHPAKAHVTHAYVAQRTEAQEPVVVGERAQPVTLARTHAAVASHRQKAATGTRAKAKTTLALAAPGPAPAVAPTTAPPAQAPAGAATPPTQPQAGETQVTQVTSDTTQLPPQATSPPTTTTPATTATPPASGEASAGTTGQETAPPSSPGTTTAASPTTGSTASTTPPPASGTATTPSGATTNASAGTAGGPAAAAQPLTSSRTGAERTAARRSHRSHRSAGARERRAAKRHRGAHRHAAPVA